MPSELERPRFAAVAGSSQPAPQAPWYPQEICLPRAGGPLGLSIVGGSDHSSHPFGIQEPGVFISKVDEAPQAFPCWEGPAWLRGSKASSLLSIPLPTGAPPGPGCTQRPSGWGPHPGSERAGHSGGHAPGGCQCPASALPGAGPAREEGPTTPRHAGTLYPEGPRGEAGHQHSRGRQGPCREPL